MKFNQLIKPLFVIMLVLGLVAGCASSPDDTGADQATAEQAIADAKSTNAQAKQMNAQWRDTGKIIDSAEAALAAGDYQKAIDLANQAQTQAENAIAQARAEEERLKANGTLSGDMMETHDTMSGGDNDYQVTRGDNLWSISGKGSIYANPYQWPLIYKANRSKIKDADLIYPGQVFDIDRDASSSDINAAVSHAKSRGAWSVGTVEATDEAYLAQ